MDISCNNSTNSAILEEKTVKLHLKTCKNKFDIRLHFILAFLRLISKNVYTLVSYFFHIRNTPKTSIKLGSDM